MREDSATAAVVARRLGVFSRVSSMGRAPNPPLSRVGARSTMRHARPIWRGVPPLSRSLDRYRTHGSLDRRD
jgi:hypothetical protein